jgi:tRNA-splicing ligase RtcB
VSEIRAVFGDHEQKVVAQLERCLSREEGSVGALMGDAHFGYSAPVGAVIAYREHVAPAAVGYDIGCGNLAVPTGLISGDDFRAAVPALMDRIAAEVSFGMGRSRGERADHPVLDEVRDADSRFQRELLDVAAKQLGTVGGGNHYVDLFADEATGRVWVGVHFGSRGFGHKTATRFMQLAARENGREYREGGGEMEAPPDVFRLDGGAGQAYLRAMELAGRYAAAGREVVVDQVLGILGTERFTGIAAVHNHHNYAWREEHDGERWWVTRKGATPAFPGQAGFVGASMGEPAVILEGAASDASERALFSTVHGAGRAMSRTRAAGRSRKRWSCNTRDCGWVQPPRSHKPDACPECGNRKMSKRWVKETEGEVDWRATLADLSRAGIELRGANAEEAPAAYKRLAEVLEHHEGTVRVVRRLRPLGVAMAPPEVRDDYKD